MALSLVLKVRSFETRKRPIRYRARFYASSAHPGTRLRKRYKGPVLSPRSSVIIGVATLAILLMGKQPFVCDRSPQGEIVSGIHDIHGKRTKELPMTVPKVSSMGLMRTQSGSTNHDKMKCTKQ